MKQADKIISARWIIPVRPKGLILEHSCIVISKNKIIDILATDTAKTKYKASLTIDLPKHALMPGLINSHTHTPMVILRGLGDSLPLKNWLEDCIWPAENKLMSELFIKEGTRLGIAEMLLNGTTCFSEHYFMPTVAAETAKEIGMRALIGIGMHDKLPDNEKNFELAKSLTSTNDLIKFAFAPHSPYMLSDQSLNKILDICQTKPMPIHIHLHETQNEIQNSITKYGKRPIARLKDLGLFTQHLIAVHMVHIDQSDLKILEQNPCHIVTCPDSNLKLGSGMCNINALQASNCNIAIGTDGAASNNDLDMLSEARNAALINKGLNHNPNLSKASDVIDMLTINGAKALGFESEVGSFEIGKAADLIAISDMHEINRDDVLDHIAFSVNCHQISDVWVAGQRLVSDRQLVNMCFDELISDAQKWQKATMPFSTIEKITV